MSTRIRPRESTLQNRIIRHLRRCGFWVRKKEPTNVGDPDIMVVVPCNGLRGPGIPVAMELKRDDDEKPSKIQVSRMERMRKQGWHCYVVKSWDSYLCIRNAYQYRCPTWKVEND